MPDDYLDLSRLQEMSGGDQNFEQEILEMYFEDAASLLDEIGRQLGTGEFDDMRRAAHSLKGSSANLGAVGVQHAAAHLETVSESGHQPTAEDAYNTLRRVYDEVERRLKSYLDG